MTKLPRKVLITGSSGSLGSSLVAAFLRDEYIVVGFDVVTPPDLPQSKSDVAATADVGSLRFVNCDLTDPRAIERALAQVKDICPFDIVINNAGEIYNSPLLSFQAGNLRIHDFDAWNRVLSATLSSAFFVTAHCAQQMVANGRTGIIVNISSICAQGNAGQVAYSAAKAGLNGMTVALAKELGGLGIRIAAIAPGYLDTPSTRNAMSEEALTKIRKATPLKRLGSAHQLYHAIKFIIENEYFHGKVLDLDGGLTL